MMKNHGKLNRLQFLIQVDCGLYLPSVSKNPTKNIVYYILYFNEAETLGIDVSKVS